MIAVISLAVVGTTQLIIILVIVVLLFGVGKLPEVGRQLGAGIKNFKNEVNTPPTEAQITDQSGPPVAAPPRDVTNEHTRS